MVLLNKKKKLSPEEKAELEQSLQDSAQGINDEFQKSGIEVVKYASRQKLLFSIFIVCFLTLGIGYAVYTNYVKRIDQEATDAYLTALKPLSTIDERGADKDEGKNNKIEEEVLVSLASVVKNYARSEVSMLAALSRGQLSLKRNDIEEAKKMFKSAYNSSKQTSLVKQAALLGLISVSEYEGDKKQTLAMLEEMTKQSYMLSGDMVLYKAAKLNMENDKKEEASAFLTKLKEQYPMSLYGNQVNKMLEELK